MTPADLLAWQNRLGLSGTEAARALGLPYFTYREYLPTGRRRSGGLPGWLPKLCRYIERYGLMEDDMAYTGFVLVTKSGRLYRQQPGKSSDPSVFASRENAEATNVSTLKGTGSVAEIVAGSFVEGARVVDGYWVRG